MDLMRVEALSQLQSIFPQTSRQVITHVINDTIKESDLLDLEQLLVRCVNRLLTTGDDVPPQQTGEVVVIEDDVKVDKTLPKIEASGSCHNQQDNQSSCYATTSSTTIDSSQHFTKTLISNNEQNSGHYDSTYVSRRLIEVSSNNSLPENGHSSMTLIDKVTFGNTNALNVNEPGNHWKSMEIIGTTVTLKERVTEAAATSDSSGKDTPTRPSLKRVLVDNGNVNITKFARSDNFQYEKPMSSPSTRTIPSTSYLSGGNIFQPNHLNEVGISGCSSTLPFQFGNRARKTVTRAPSTVSRYPEPSPNDVSITGFSGASESLLSYPPVSKSEESNNPISRNNLHTGDTDFNLLPPTTTKKIEASNLNQPTTSNNYFGIVPNIGPNHSHVSAFQNYPKPGDIFQNPRQSHGFIETQLNQNLMHTYVPLDVDNLHNPVGTPGDMHNLHNPVGTPGDMHNLHNPVGTPGDMHNLHYPFRTPGDVQNPGDVHNLRNPVGTRGDLHNPVGNHKLIVADNQIDGLTYVPMYKPVGFNDAKIGSNNDSVRDVNVNGRQVVVNEVDLHGVQGHMPTKSQFNIYQPLKQPEGAIDLTPTIGQEATHMVPLVEQRPIPEPVPEPVDEQPEPEVEQESDIDVQMVDVVNLFPEIDLQFLRSKLPGFQGGGNQAAVERIVNYLLENPYPKQVKHTDGTTKEQVETDYFKEFNHYPSQEYMNQVTSIMLAKYPKISTKSLRAILDLHKYHYAPTEKAIQQMLKENKDLAENLALQGRRRVAYSSLASFNVGDIRQLLQIVTLRYGRGSYRPTKITNRELQKEMDFYNQHVQKEIEYIDRKIAVTLNEEEYEQEGQLIECGCCYDEVAFEEMVQCSDGHLFCSTCMNSYAKEAVYGSGKLNFFCMSDGCEVGFPKSQLDKCLTKEIIKKYEERLKEESLNLADLDDLIKCPFCEFAAIMDSDDKVFKCQNPKCLKESCRHCKESWKDHFGIPCSEIEKKDETSLRVTYEERMTNAKMRTCFRCKTGYMKSDGCNKITCRCGAKMCYICREPNINYNHFCQHVRSPGQGCNVCNSCSLWSDPKEDDERAIKEIQRQLKEERKSKGY